MAKRDFSPQETQSWGSNFMIIQRKLVSGGWLMGCESTVAGTSQPGTSQRLLEKVAAGLNPERWVTIIQATEQNV